MNQYLNPHFSGKYVQATIQGIEDSFNDTLELINYISNINLDNAIDVDLDNLGLLIGYKRPIVDGVLLEKSVYIALLKMIAIAKYNGFTFSTLDTIAYYILFTLGGNGNYIYKWSANGVSSPNADIIINLMSNAVDDKYLYILNTVLDIFLTQGVKVNVVNNPFCFAFWNGSAWDENPEGKGFSRLINGTVDLTYSDGYTATFDDGDDIEMFSGSGVINEADTSYGGQMYAVL